MNLCRLILATLLLLLPVAAHGQVYNVPFSPPAAEGGPTPAYTNGFELTAVSTTNCQDDDGVPADISVNGVGNCNFSDATADSGAGSGSQVAEVANGETVQMNLAWDAASEGWLRYRYYHTTASTSNNRFHARLNDNSTNSGAVQQDSNGSMQLRCRGSVDGNNTSSLTLATWYIFDLHWTGHDGIDATPEMDLSVYLESTQVLITDGSISCEGDQVTSIPTGIEFEATVTGGQAFRLDCVEYYTSDPGAPTAACNMLPAE